jgi:hypothetical protein
MKCAGLCGAGFLWPLLNKLKNTLIVWSTTCLSVVLQTVAARCLAVIVCTSGVGVCICGCSVNNTLVCAAYHVLMLRPVWATVLSWRPKCTMAAPMIALFVCVGHCRNHALVCGAASMCAVVARSDPTAWVRQVLGAKCMCFVLLGHVCVYRCSNAAYLHLSHVGIGCVVCNKRLEYCVHCRPQCVSVCHVLPCPAPWWSPGH